MAHVDLIAHVVAVVSEAEFVHVGLDVPAGEVLGAVAVARLQLVGARLSTEDVDGVHAALGALPTPEHGPAELVVVLQGFAAGGVRGADPPGGRARHLSVGLDRISHLGLAGLDVGLAPNAQVVPLAIAL